MKSAAKFYEWIAGAVAQFGDPSVVVCQLFFRWVEQPRAASDDLVCGMEEGDVVIALGPDDAMTIPLQLGEPEITEGGVITFGAEQMAPGLWVVTPSFNVPGVIHAFIVLYGVPDPAPWERRIVVASRIEVPA